MSNATYIYQLPNETYSDGLLGLMGYSNSVSDGIFMPMMILVVYSVLFIISLSVTSASKAFAFTSLVCAILSMPLAVLGMFAPSYMYLLFFLTGIGVIWMTLESRS